MADQIVKLKDGRYAVYELMDLGGASGPERILKGIADPKQPPIQLDGMAFRKLVQ